MISKETVRGKYPVKNLSDVAEFLDSLRRPITASNRVPGPYPYYGANGQQDSVADYIFDEPLILLAEDGGLFDQPDRGIAYAIEGKSWVNNHAHVLRARKDVSQGYLLRVLENYDVTPWINGSTRAKLTKAGASKIQIPLPPLEKQKRIAEILDAAADLRAKRRESLAQLDTLVQSTFLDMFGDPVTNTMGWPLKPLGRVATLQRGFDLPVQQRQEGSVPIFAANGQIGTHNTHRVEGPGVVTGRSGTLGKVHYVSTDFWPLNTALWVKNFHENDPLWVCELLNQMRLEQFTRGVGVPTLNRNLVHVVEIPLPPIHLQQRFAAIVDSIEQQKVKQRAHLEELDTLFASLQSRAFAGELI